MNRKHTVCKLPQPFQAQVNINGKFEHTEVSDIYLTEPTGRQCYITLKQLSGLMLKASVLFQKDLPQNNTTNNDNKENKLDANAILTIISSNANICGEYYEILNTLLASNVCYFDQELKQPLQQFHFEMLANESLDVLYKTYINFFSQYFLPQQN